MNDLTILIMAAGKGTRFKSSLPKVLHLLAGIPIVAYVIRVAQELSPTAIGVVVGHESQKIRAVLAEYPVQFIQQSPQLGTGHAVQTAKTFWEPQKGALMILSGDVPLITCGTKGCHPH
jgi:bifunctional UDP-N-acetylglucosamine pyrophosphorylase/glucosamine-1-phosphate N-acetyltransferase